MIESLKALFSSPDPADSEEMEHQLRLAAAALLVEITRADYEIDDNEQRTIQEVLHTALGLPHEEIEELIRLAGQSADKAVSLYEFTSLINDHYDKEQKLVLIQSMWQVAYADGDLDKYEERLIRQVSDLIHVSHGDYIRLKLQTAS